MIDNDMTKTASKPPLILSAADYERLNVLANAARKRMPDLADELAYEIGRARVLGKGKHPQDTVCMNNEVEFRDDTTGKVQRVTLVYPDEADISQRKVSVLTPVGTALIGLRAGSSITWETPSGDLRRLTVLSVGELGRREASTHSVPHPHVEAAPSRSSPDVLRQFEG